MNALYAHRRKHYLLTAMSLQRLYCDGSEFCGNVPFRNLFLHYYMCYPGPLHYDVPSCRHAPLIKTFSNWFELLWLRTEPLISRWQTDAFCTVVCIHSTKWCNQDVSIPFNGQVSDQICDAKHYMPHFRATLDDPPPPKPHLLNAPDYTLYSLSHIACVFPDNVFF